MRVWVRMLCWPLLGVAVLFAQGGFRIRDGDRVLVCGERPGDRNSIGPLLESYIVTRFPAWDVSFRHCGCAEDARLEREIAEYKPTQVVLLARAPDANSLRRLAMLRRALPEAILTVVDAESHREAQVAVEMPPEAGAAETVEAILSAWDAPAAATDVELDVLTGSAAKAENTTLHALEIYRVVSWSQDDRALPGPGTLAPASRELLRVRGLPEQRYVLTIDGRRVATFWRDQLERGIDLAAVRTPMTQQADSVHQLTLERAALDWARWTAAGSAAELSAREAGIVERRRGAAQPRTRDYELQPAVE